MKKYIVLALLFISYNGLAQLNIVPMPAEIKLGEGSFGKVIRAFDPLRKKNIAVKLIKCNSEN